MSAPDLDRLLQRFLADLEEEPDPVARKAFANIHLAIHAVHVDVRGLKAQHALLEGRMDRSEERQGQFEERQNRHGKSIRALKQRGEFDVSEDTGVHNIPPEFAVLANRVETMEKARADSDARKLKARTFLKQETIKSMLRVAAVVAAASIIACGGYVAHALGHPAPTTESHR